MPGRVDFEIGLGPARGNRGAVREAGVPLRILVFGDFSGRYGREDGRATDLASRTVLRIDVDNFDAVLARISPSVVLRGLPGHDDLRRDLQSVDDFHPDRLYESLEAFRSLRNSRARLTNPTTFDEEARRLTETPAAATASAAPEATEDKDTLLRRLIGSPSGGEHRPTTSSGVVDRLIRELVGSTGGPGSGESPVPYLTAVDAALSELMRAVLHQPALQSLEAAWRGLRRFVDSVDLGEQLTLHVADVGKEELDADLASCEGDLSDSGTYRLVGESSRRGAEAGNWTLLVGLYRFGATERDLRLMERLAAVAATLHTPLLADAEPSLLGSRGLPADPDPRNWSIADDPVAARWQALRASPSARWLGLAIPRILQRLPYGARTEPIESFAFEEMAGDEGHEDYLWGSAALACAQAMGSAAVDGLDGLPSCGALELDDLPAHTRRINGETVLQPCAEVLLPLGTGEVVSRHGIIPMLSYSGRNAVRVMSVQSIADPPGALAGAVDGLLGVTEDRSP